MISILHSIFLKDVVNTIEEKYKNQLKLTNEDIFTYSNIFNMPLYYKLATFKKNPDYNLYNKLQKNKQFETTYYCIEKILENNYDPNLVLFLYSYISNIALNNMIDSYIDNFLNQKKLTKKRKMNLRSKIANILESDIYFSHYNEKIKNHKINHKEIKIDDLSIKLIDEIFIKFHYFSFGKDVFNISFNNFKKYQAKKNSWLKGIYKLSAKMKDIFTRSKKYSMYSIYHIYKKDKTDYLNINNQSFANIYQETVKNTSYLINLISEEIYYKKKNEKIIKNILNK